MIKFDKPESFNGTQLLDELAEIGIVLDKYWQPPVLDENGDLWLDIKEADKNKVKVVLDKHVGVDKVIEPTPAEKLAAAGLSVDELKSLLGLNA